MRLAEIVQKFGGTSMGSVEAIRAAGDRVEEARQEGRVAVVVSAARPPGMKGTTDRLLELARVAESGRSPVDLLDELFRIHDRIAQQLSVNVDVGNFRQELDGLLSRRAPAIPLSPQRRDRIQTMGERIMHRIFAAHLCDRGVPALPVDAMELIITDDTYGNGAVDTDRTFMLIRSRLRGIIGEYVPVVPGFYGREMDRWNIVAFSRGGSDYSGALLAAGLQAARYDVCTDVPGVQAAHPKRYPDAPIIPQLSYRELLALSLGGATVVHRKAIGPVMNGGPERQPIPMRIVDTMTGKSETSVSPQEHMGAKGVASKHQEEVIVQVFDPGMVDVPGYAERIADVFRQESVSVDVIATDEATISVTAPETDALRRAVEKLSRICHQVEVFPQRGIIAVVGSHLGRVQGFFRRLFSVVGDEGIQMISMGTHNSVTFLVDRNHTTSAEQRIYDEFFAPRLS